MQTVSRVRNACESGAQWDTIWQGDAYSRADLRAARARQKVGFLEDLGILVEAKDVVLDVGCGSGAVIRELASRGLQPQRWLACDASQVACREATSGFHSAGIPVDLRWADARRLPFEDAAVTVALAIGVLEHIPDPEVALAEIRRVLQPNGLLIAVTSHRRSIVYFQRRMREALRLWPYGFQNNLSVGRCRALLESSFQLEELQLRHTAWDFPLAAAADRLLSRVAGPWGRYLVARCRRSRR